MTLNDSRPNPDELLARVEAEEEQQKSGKLKIFLGYAAGVGKTFTMLEAAHQRKKDTDIVVAYVETHGRAETEALLEGLEIVPRKQVEYRGVRLSEMDLDAVLLRRPQLALVDELAHTNAPDSRYLKRYQDVEELLEAGIDVYTTLNIQHIESLQNMVAHITGVWVRETVPDSVVDNAAEIEIVDLPSDELLKRLKEGKVYVPEQIAHATAQFFRKGNLIALRELTMRTAAQHVDKHKQAYMEAHAIRGPWPSADRLLVCVSPGPVGPLLVRNTRRLANQLAAEWFAVNVATPDSDRLPPDQQDRMMSTLRLAERMGAKTETLRGDSIAAAVTEFARKHNITKIVVGKPQKTRWQNPFGRSVVNQIIRQSQHLDVYVISGDREEAKSEETPGRPVSRNRRGYLLGLGLVVLATLLGQLVHVLFAPTNLAMIYLLFVAITAIFWGFGPSIMVSILSVVAFDFFFVPPFLSFAVGDMEHLSTLIALLLIGVIISYLTTLIRRQTEAARRRERETATLYALSRDLSISNDLESYIRAIIKRTKETFGRETIIFLPDTQNKLLLKPHSEIAGLTIDEKEAAAALYSFQHQKIIGSGTDTLPSAKARYLPLITARGTMGVMALWSSDNAGELTGEQERLLEACADLDALAIEGIQLAEEAHNAQILRATEKLQTALLNSISHDLRTPLVSIIGALSSLQEEGMGLDDAARKNLVQVASEEAERLNHLITNLLDMSRIDAGAVMIYRQSSDLEDIIGVALKQLSRNLENRQVKINLPAERPFVSVDFGLIVQTLVNILDNALKYSPADSPVEIGARQVGKEIQIEVADRGIGIPPQDLTRVFDKFYRVQRPDYVTGTGLGLSICKGFVEAHGGRIWAENRPGGGTVIKLTLPIAEAAESARDKNG